MLIFRSLLYRISNQNIPSDTARKALQFTQENLFRSCTSCFENRQSLEGSHFEYCKSSSQRILLFLKTITRSLADKIVELFALHLVMYFLFPLIIFL